MATCLISQRMFAITLMTTLALTAVARPMFAADYDAADLVPGEPRVVGALPRGVTPGPTGSILDSARRQLSRQVASKAEQDRGETRRKDTLWNGALIGAIGGGVFGGWNGTHRDLNESSNMVPLTNVCKESKSSPRLNCVESATCESQQ